MLMNVDLQAGYHCHCGNKHGSHGRAKGKCHTPCPGNRKQICGSGEKAVVYKML